MSKFLGVDLGGTRMRAIVMDEQGQIYDQSEDLTHSESGSEAVIERLLQFIENIFSKHEIAAIGIGSPGPIDYEAGIVLYTPNMPFKNVPLRSLIQEKFRLPVAMDRDANCALIGEHWKGEAKGYKNIAMLIWGTGVGGALILNDKIYRGHSDLAGELGHMIVNENGPHCSLGHNGCLEKMIGGKAIEQKYGKNFKDISAGARAGNINEQQIVREIGDYLSIALKNIVTLFDPELILLDGGCTKDFDLFMDQIKDMPVKLSRFAKDAGVWGAARIAMDAKEEL